MSDTVERLWGTYRVIDSGAEYRVKELCIHSGKALSNQYHNHRDEVWNVVEGEVNIVVAPIDGSEEEQILFLKEQSSYRIPKGWWHKAFNPSTNKDAKVIEIWFGKILDESDIIREER